MKIVTDTGTIELGTTETTPRIGIVDYSKRVTDDFGVGTLLVGQIVGLGITEAAPSAGITDFSRKVVDDFGEVTVVQAVLDPSQVAELEAIARTALTVQIGQIRATVLSEAQASVTRDSLLTQRIDAQGGVLDNQAAAIGRLDRVSLDNAGGIASAQMTIRQQIGAADSSDEALLRALVAGDQADRARIAQAVQIQTEFTTTLVENERAAAVARQALLARMNAADAAIVTTARVAAEANQATAQRVSALEVAFNDASTGLLATRARIVALEEATASRNAAFAQQLELIEATVGGQGDGLAAISATVAQDRQARVDGDAANASAVEQVRTQVTTANASLELGPFGTTGKPKSVVASYSYSLRRRVNPPGGSITGTPSATLKLERRRGSDGPWVELQTGTITGETSYAAPEGATLGLGTQTMSGAITITDNSDGAQDFSYRLTLVSRTLATFNFSSPNDGPAGEPIQSLSLVSVEQ